MITMIEIEAHGLWWQQLTVFLASQQLNWQPGQPEYITFTRISLDEGLICGG